MVNMYSYSQHEVRQPVAISGGGQPRIVEPLSKLLVARKIDMLHKLHNNGKDLDATTGQQSVRAWLARLASERAWYRLPWRVRDQCRPMSAGDIAFWTEVARLAAIGLRHDDAEQGRVGTSVVDGHDGVAEPGHSREQPVRRDPLADDLKPADPRQNQP